MKSTLKRKADLTLETFSALPGTGPTGAVPTDLCWRGKSIHFYSEKLRQKALEAQERAAAVAEERAKPHDFLAGTTALNQCVELYDKLFTSYHDAIAMVKHGQAQPLMSMM